MLHLSQSDPATIGFVVQCLTLGVITNEELRAWAEEVLVASDDCPIYVEGLAEFDGPPGEVSRTLGFVPGREFSPAEVAALEGILNLRKAPPANADTPEPNAAPELERHPELLDEFRRTFPLLRLEQPTATPR